jgi:hypothetical protein
MTTKTKNESRYTPAMVAMILESEVLNQARAQELAAAFSEMSGETFTEKGVIAKIGRMEGVTYVPKAKVSKTGGKIETKEDLVAEIAALVEGNLTGLEKASKQALQAVRNALVA